MRKIFLSAGHTNIPGKDRGASASHKLLDYPLKTYIEGDMAAEFCAKLYQKLFAKGVPVYLDPFGHDLAAAMKAIKPMIKKSDVCIEYHWNSAADPSATGSEVIIPGRAGKEIEYSLFEKKWATDMAKLHATVMGIKNRGVKMEKESHHKSLGWMRLPSENLLVEWAFISNPKDVAAYLAYESELLDHEANLLEMVAKS